MPLQTLACCWALQYASRFCWTPRGFGVLFAGPSNSPCPSNPIRDVSCITANRHYEVFSGCRLYQSTLPSLLTYIIASPDTAGKVSDDVYFHLSTSLYVWISMPVLSYHEGVLCKWHGSKEKGSLGTWRCSSDMIWHHSRWSNWFYRKQSSTIIDLSFHVSSTCCV